MSPLSRYFAQYGQSMLDSVDRGLLELLLQNCRLLDAALAAALGISKDSVRYRRAQLEKRGYIRDYMIFVDARRLGFTRYHLLLQLQRPLMDPARTASRIAGHPYVMWINSYIGKYDLQVIVDAKDNFHLNVICREIFSLGRLRVRDFIVLTHLYDLEFTQLVPELSKGVKVPLRDDSAFGSRLTKRRFPVTRKFEPASISELEGEILRVLADEPQIALVEIGRRLGCDRQTVRRHIQRLIDDKVLLQMTAVPDLSLLGYVTYYLLVRLEQHIPDKALERPFQELPNIFYAGRMVGDYDLILYLNARTPSELYHGTGLLRDRLGKYIVNYDLLVQDKLYHWRQMTDGIFRSLEQRA